MPGSYQSVFERGRSDFLRARSQMRLSGEKPSWLLYTIVGLFALLKDLLDIAFGFLPGLGTAVSLMFGIGFSIIFFLLLSIFDRSGAGSRKNRAVANHLVRRFMVLIGTLLVDVLPLLNFLPVTTLSIMLLYWLAKREWKKRQRDEQMSLRQTQNILYA